MFKKSYKKIFILIPILLVLFFVFLRVNRETIQSQILLNVIDTTSSYSINILAGDINVHISFKSGMSLYEVMKEAREKKQIDFKGRNYPGLGFFVTDVGSLHENNNQNLMYYINGQEAEVGISSYLPQDGDIISWELK